MERSVQAFEMKTLISALLDFTEPNFQGLPLCGPGKGKKAKINGKNSLDVMLRPELQPFPVCTPRGFIRFAKSDTRRPLHPCLRSNQDQFRLEVPPGSLSPQPCPTCWLLARELPAIPFATALTPHHSRVEAQPRKCLESVPGQPWTCGDRKPAESCLREQTHLGLCRGPCVAGPCSLQRSLAPSSFTASAILRPHSFRSSHTLFVCL